MNFKRNETPQKLRGGYYTDIETALFLSRWALAGGAKSVLEPSCGDGVFFTALKENKNQRLQKILAFEIEKNEFEKAREVGCRLFGDRLVAMREDFLAWSLKSFLGGMKFDAVVGNPPYIRYQYLDQRLQSVAEGIFSYHHLPFTKHTNAWVSFVISSLALLRPTGRLAMVLPAELLHVLHAQPLRDYLSQQCERILVVDPEELWFEGVLQGAILVLAEKKAEKEMASRGVAIVQTRSREFLKTNPESVFEKAEFLNGGTISGKWVKALLTKTERDLMTDVAARKDVSPFIDVADVDVGIVTGANSFFLVSDSIVNEYELRRWAHPMFGRSEHVNGVIYDKTSHSLNQTKGLPTNFIWFKDEESSSLPKRVRSYISKGERLGLPERYKCRIRNPWYAVPSVYVAPVGMLKRSHDYPRLVLNRAKAFTTDTAYRIKPKRILPSRLVYSFVNSLTVLTSELEGRHYGGGVLELVPSEIEKLLIPLPTTAKIQLRKLNQMFIGGVTAEEILHQQDLNLLRPLGLSSTQVARIFEAWNKLRKRRQRISSERID